MRRLGVSLSLWLGALGVLAAPALAAFGFEQLGLRFHEQDGSIAVAAGTHPYGVTTTINVNTTETPAGQIPDGETKDLRISLPVGFTGNPTAVPRCTAAEFADVDVPKSLPGCPNASTVGIASLRLEYKAIPPGETKTLHVPVYNLVPPPGAVAQLGFLGLNVPIFVVLRVNPSPPYNVLAKLRNIPQAVLFYGSELTVWGNPAAKIHDSERGSCLDAGKPGDGPISVGSCPVDVSVEPFVTLPRACQGPLESRFAASSWQQPSPFVEGSVLTEAMSGCSALHFSPDITAQPTTTSAESASGLDFSIAVKDEGLTDAEGTAHSDIKEIVTTLPAGITVNPSSAVGLNVCTKAQYEAASLDQQGCPDASKFGNVEVKSPLLKESLNGSLFLAAQDDPATAEAGAENPFDSLLALYVVIRNANYGIFIKQAGKVQPNLKTGQLITTFADLPQVPLSEINLRFREGPRSPLVTPPGCGTYTTTALFYPWARPSSPIESTSTFVISSGVGGGPCPQGGAGPFDPGFQAGTLNNNAGSHSPFRMRLTRRDGDQDLTRFAAELPPGLVARLAGVQQCPDAAIARAKARTGRQEQASPSCSAASRIGGVWAGAGVGHVLTYVPGSLHLAGPYNGAPLSVAAIVPAVAGPFDVGTVVTRVALRIDSRTARVTVDGAASDPIPHILAGIPLRVRDIRVDVDRPDFTLNPTSCDPFEVGARIWGGGSDAFSLADDAPVSRAARFQAASCSALGFRPRLSLALRGGTGRGAHPALRGAFRPRPGDANLRRLVLRLPRSDFLDQAHIRTICTRVQFAAGAGNGAGCPKGAVYGRARAWTPLLDKPLEGPVYLRSSDHNLPDFVAALHGLVDVEAVARIDSVRGGIRATFTDLPDAPLSKVVVRMQGGRKGLIVNSRNLCFRPKRNRARAEFDAHNGRIRDFRPVVRARCGKKAAKRGKQRKR